MQEVETTDLFDAWLQAQDEELQVKILAGLNLIEQVGPTLARPYTFDPVRNAIVFCTGDKKGANEKKFYAEMIKTADSEFEKHLKKLKLEK